MTAKSEAVSFFIATVQASVKYIKFVARGSCFLFSTSLLALFSTIFSYTMAGESKKGVDF